MRIHVIVQTCPERQRYLHRTTRSIEQSDIGADYEVMEQRDAIPLRRGMPKAERAEHKRRVFKHFEAVLRALYESGADYGLRLEDDIRVNRHVLHNLRTWPARRREGGFGVGWLFMPEGMLGDGHNVARTAKTATPYRKLGQMYGALGVLFPRDHILPVIPEVGRYGQDLAIGAAMHRMKKLVCFHEPSLVESDLTVPSTRGHRLDARYHQAGSNFQIDWRR